MIQSKKLCLERLVATVGEDKSALKYLTRKLSQRRPLGIPRRIYEDKVIIGLCSESKL